ncbi:MAG: tRNA preQ1(34) S-adenosylmethionine ribosyltransferase-isomerase QueA [Clostridia bacterium]|nr:tRNA preQ1(34) S-adenosylmethionine ribosyltransferase-isomerase QueA [Clostridia bacterium]
MNIDLFDYDLPEELIAQHPSEKRDECRLMVLNREQNTIEHKIFKDIIDELHQGDLLVLNNSKVIPARLYGIKDKTGAIAEFLLTKHLGEDRWETLVKPGKKLKPGDSVIFDNEDCKLKANILDYGKDGTRIVKFEYDGIFLEVLEKLGSMPLPPYINRKTDKNDRERYQTVYCDKEGSVAAPTAGLHFTNELLEAITAKGVQIAYVTLHVGIVTFRPVKVEKIEDHSMHFEEYYIDPDTAEVINQHILDGKRVVAVGTTSVRTLESAAYLDEKSGKYLVKSGEDDTSIFIFPGYKFKVVNALITNFHLPKSTLLMLISALYDREEILKAYEEAVKEEYQFFSYGDAMFIK